MKTLKIDLNNIKQSEMNEIVDNFQRGKVVAYPTDTVYGLGCITTDKKAIAKVFKIKKRSKNKPVIILIKSYCMLKDYFMVSKKQDEYLRSVWVKKVSDLSYLKNIESKKAVTVILNKKKAKLDYLPSIKDSLAVRLPKSDFLIKMIKRVNVPLVSTSLNVSGEKEVSDLSKINNDILKNVDLLVDAGPLPLKKTSSVMDIRDVENIKIIRK